MAYPNSIASFTNPSGTSLVTNPDHANLHTLVNTDITAIENVLGTTAGTSVLKNFNAGEFPVRVNTGGTLVQTVTGGTLANPTIGTPSVTSGTTTNGVLVTPTIGTPVINVGSDATGDLYYRNAGAFARLAMGAASTFLTTNGTTPSWGTVSPPRFKSGSFTRLRDAGSGTVGITGVGFTPKAVVFLSAVDNAQGWSVGVDSGTTPFCLAFPISGTVVNMRTTGAIHSRDNSSWEVSGSVNTFTSDGFVMGWTFGGSPPAGTITAYYLAMG